MPRVLDPTNDVVFKLLFGHPDHEGLLIALLNAVLLPPTPIVRATVLNPELGKVVLSDKVVRLDVRCRLQDGTLVDVEMQAYRQGELPERLLYYWARAYGAQLQAGQPWRDLVPCISVVFLTHDALGNGLRHNVFELRSLQDGRSFSGHLRLHLVQLPCPEGPEHNEALDHWVRFLAARTDEEVAEVARMDPVIAQAQDVLGVMARDPSARELAEARLDAERTRRQLWEEGRQEGKAEGKAELVSRQLRLKFGELPVWAEERLAKATAVELDAWSERLLAAQTLREVVGSE